MPDSKPNLFTHELRSVLRDYWKVFAAYAALLTTGTGSFIAIVTTPGIPETPSQSLPLLSVVQFLAIAAAAALGHLLIAPINPLSPSSQSRTVPIPIRTLISARLSLLVAMCVALPCVATAVAIGVTFPTAVPERTGVAAVTLWIAIWAGTLSALTLTIGTERARVIRCAQCLLIVALPAIALFALNTISDGAWTEPDADVNLAVNGCLLLMILAVYLPARAVLLMKRADKGIPLLWEAPLWLALTPFFWHFPSERLPKTAAPITAPPCVVVEKAPHVQSVATGMTVSIPLPELRDPLFPDSGPVEIHWEEQAGAANPRQEPQHRAMAQMVVNFQATHARDPQAQPPTLTLTFPFVATADTLPGWETVRGKTLRLTGRIRGEQYDPKRFADFPAEMGGSWRTAMSLRYVSPAEFDEGTMRVKIRTVRLRPIFERSSAFNEETRFSLFERSRRKSAHVGPHDSKSADGAGVEERIDTYDHTAPAGFDEAHLKTTSIGLANRTHRDAIIPFEITLRLPNE